MGWKAGYAKSRTSAYDRLDWTGGNVFECGRDRDVRFEYVDILLSAYDGMRSRGCGRCESCGSSDCDDETAKDGGVALAIVVVDVLVEGAAMTCAMPSCRAALMLLAGSLLRSSRRPLFRPTAQRADY